MVINVFPKEILFLKKDKKSKGRIYKIAALILLVLMGGFLIVYGAVSYTHLDVYKRQDLKRNFYAVYHRRRVLNRVARDFIAMVKESISHYQ